MQDPIFGQGTGISGRYGGLPDQFFHLKDAQIVILPVPFDLTTTYQHGTCHGPAALIEASRNMELYDIETSLEVYKKGIYTAPAISADTCKQLQSDLYQTVKGFLSAKKFVVTVGGEHSISYGAFKAHLEQFKSVSILQLDAHADLQDAYEGNPFSHASVMARIIELPLSSAVAVGIRSMSAEELENQQHVHTFFSHELLDPSFDWMEKAIEKLGENVYLTFDLDVFDYSLMPSTGTPEPGGLSWDTALHFIKKVVKKRRLVGFDVVELLPNRQNIAPDYLAAKLIYKILSYKFKAEA